jgi:hypothetical protein
LLVVWLNVLEHADDTIDSSQIALQTAYTSLSQAETQVESKRRTKPKLPQNVERTEPAQFDPAKTEFDEQTSIWSKELFTLESIQKTRAKAVSTALKQVYDPEGTLEILGMRFSLPLVHVAPLWNVSLCMLIWFLFLQRRKFWIHCIASHRRVGETPLISYMPWWAAPLPYGFDSNVTRLTAGWNTERRILFSAGVLVTGSVFLLLQLHVARLPIEIPEITKIGNLAVSLKEVPDLSPRLFSLYMNKIYNHGASDSVVSWMALVFSLLAVWLWLTRPLLSRQQRRPLPMLSSRVGEAILWSLPVVVTIVVLTFEMDFGSQSRNILFSIRYSLIAAIICALMLLFLLEGTFRRLRKPVQVKLSPARRNMLRLFTMIPAALAGWQGGSLLGTNIWRLHPNPRYRKTSKSGHLKDLPSSIPDGFLGRKPAPAGAPPLEIERRYLSLPFAGDVESALVANANDRMMASHTLPFAGDVEPDNLLPHPLAWDSKRWLTNGTSSNDKLSPRVNLPRASALFELAALDQLNQGKGVDACELLLEGIYQDMWLKKKIGKIELCSVRLYDLLAKIIFGTNLYQFEARLQNALDAILSGWQQDKGHKPKTIRKFAAWQARRVKWFDCGSKWRQATQTTAKHEWHYPIHKLSDDQKTSFISLDIFSIKPQTASPSK